MALDPGSALGERTSPWSERLHGPCVHLNGHQSWDKNRLVAPPAQSAPLKFTMTLRIVISKGLFLNG
jgi:hypothetical protein